MRNIIQLLHVKVCSKLIVSAMLFLILIPVAHSDPDENRAGEIRKTIVMLFLAAHGVVSLIPATIEYKNSNEGPKSILPIYAGSLSGGFAGTYMGIQVESNTGYNLTPPLVTIAGSSVVGMFMGSKLGGILYAKFKIRNFSVLPVVSQNHADLRASFNY